MNWNIAVHYHLTEILRPQGAREEVFIHPEHLMLKVYSHLAKLDVDFIREYFPNVEALGDLPGGFIKHEPANAHEIFRALRSVHELDNSAAVSPDRLDSFADREGLNLVIQTVLSESLNYCLWLKPDCYAKYTKPIYLASIAWPLGDLHALSAKNLASKRFKLKTEGRITSELSALVDTLSSMFGPGNSKFLFGDSPMTTDVILYSYLSPLLAIPAQLTPWDQNFQRLKAFLLDFDDYLWRVSRDNLTSTSCLVNPDGLAVVPVGPALSKELRYSFMALCGAAAVAMVALNSK